MKKIFNKSLKIRWSLIILIIIVGLTIAALIVYFLLDPGLRIEAVLASTIAGLFVALIQFIIAWNDYRVTENIQTLSILNVFVDRNRQDFYRNYINKAEDKVDVMGVTAYRLMDHFADLSDHAQPDTKVLLQKLTQGVKVRILVPHPAHLQGKNIDKAKMANEVFRKVKERHNNFYVRYFDHIPTHSIFSVDEESIIGPVFPEIESKNTPAIYIKSSSPYAKRYTEYFDKEWKQAEQKQSEQKQPRLKSSSIPDFTSL